MPLATPWFLTVFSTTRADWAAPRNLEFNRLHMASGPLHILFPCLLGTFFDLWPHLTQPAGLSWDHRSWAPVHRAPTRSTLLISSPVPLCLPASVALWFNVWKFLLLWLWVISLTLPAYMENKMVSYIESSAVQTLFGLFYSNCYYCFTRTWDPRRSKSCDRVTSQRLEEAQRA